jgi:hypothetical protein
MTMNVITTVLGSTGLFSAIYLLYIMAQLSKKIGEVTKMPDYYRGFYISQLLVVIALVSYFLRASVRLSPQGVNPTFGNPLFYSLTYHLPLTLGATIALVITWRYWGWLLRERDG